MTVYYILLISLFWGVLYLDRTPICASNITGQERVSSRSAKVFFFLCAVFIIIIVAFRGRMSTDYSAYEMGFLRVKTKSWAEIISNGYRVDYGGVEAGFELFRKAASIFIEKSQNFMALISIITYVPVIRVIRKKSIMPFLSLLVLISIGMFFDSFNVARSCMVSGLSFLLIDDMQEGKSKKVIFYSLILTLFHSTALFLIPIYFIIRLNLFRKGKMIVTVIGALAISLSFSYIFSLADRLLFSSFYTLTSQSSGLQAGAFGNTIPGILVMLLLLVAMPRFNYENIKERIIVNGCFIWCCLRIMILQMSFFTRFTDLTCVFPILAIPLAIYRLTERENEYLNRIVIRSVFALLLIVWTLFILKDSPYNPFYFIWNM